MIEKSKVYPQFTYAPQRYQMDHFHNPYLAKLSFKLTPKPTVASYKLMSPLSLQNNMHISQSIPLYRNQRFKLALIWKQYVTNKYARAHFGTSIEYKLYESLRIKSRAMVGTTSLFDIEICKQLTKHVQGFVGYSGLLQSNSLFNSFNVGLRKGLFYASLTNKMSNIASITVGGSKELVAGMFLQSTFDANLKDLNKGQIKLNLSQKIDDKSIASFGIAFSPYYQEGSLRVQYQRNLTKTQKVLFSTEYLQGKSIFYLGFKNLNFNFAFPFFAVDGPIPLIVGAIGFLSSYLYNRIRRRDNKYNQIVIEQKTEQARLEELKLISDKAADSYEREKLNRRGILIEEAFIGPQDQIEQFMDNPHRFQLLLRNQQYRQKFVDLTVTLRFYVMKGQLKLRKGQKNGLLGFYRKRNSHNKIGIRYIKDGNTRTVFFNYMDPIVIQNERE